MATPQVTPNWFVPTGPAGPMPRTNAMPAFQLPPQAPPQTRLLSGNTRRPANRVSSTASTVVGNSKGGSKRKTHRRKSHRRKSYRRKSHKRKTYRRRN
jgi:hypothetical protein